MPASTSFWSFNVWHFLGYVTLFLLMGALFVMHIVDTVITNRDRKADGNDSW